MKLFQSRRKPKYLAVCEYWVYLRNPKMPPQNAVMLRMQQPRGEGDCVLPPVEPGDALLFSDIRLHVAMVLRSKNAHLFRPDLFEQHIEPTPEILTELAAAQGLAKARFISEEPLTDDRHLRFMPRLAEAIASMGAAKVVFDSVAERLETADHLRDEIRRHPSIDNPDFHLHIVWTPCDGGGQAGTRGLVKIGLPELVTPTTRGDHEAIVRELLRLAAERIWQERALPESIRLNCYDDTFEVQIGSGRKGPLQARIVRVPNA